MKPYKPFFPLWVTLKEDITFSDINKSKGMSNLTRKFRKQRSSKMGAETKNAKLIDVEVDQTGNYVTFIWLTEATPYPEDPNHKYGEVDIEGNKEIHRNRSETYEIKVRILNFFDWLDTYPEGTPIKSTDFKDIMRISNIKISCNCPSFQWQGANYNLSQLDGSIYPTNIPDPVWGPRHGGNAFLCKHSQGIINAFATWTKYMAPMLNKKLKQRGII